MESLDAQHRTLLQVADPTFLLLFEVPPVLVLIRRVFLELSARLFGYCLRRSKLTREKSCFVFAFRSVLLFDLERFISCGIHFLALEVLDDVKRFSPEMRGEFLVKNDDNLTFSHGRFCLKFSYLAQKSQT
jgi:hypothetical protein